MEGRFYQSFQSDGELYLNVHIFCDLIAKLWRMNKRLALLMQESQSWNSQFTQFQGFTEKLSTEASDLRTKLEKERREAKRLSSVVHESKQVQEDLSKKLQQAEEAHKEAIEELERIEIFKKELQEQRDIIFNEITSIANFTEDNNILNEINNKIELKSDVWSIKSASTATIPSSPSKKRTPSRSSMTLLRAPSKASMRSARAASPGPTSPSTTSNNGLNRSRRTSTSSNATTQTLTEVAEDGTERGDDVLDEEENGVFVHDLEEDEYFEVAAMRRMVSIVFHLLKAISHKRQI